TNNRAIPVYYSYFYKVIHAFMKKLLVPTDFSDNAFQAAQYAAEIGKRQNFSLHIVHYYTATSSGFDDAELTEVQEQPNILKADITIKEWVGKLQDKHPELSISYHNERGLLEEALPREAKEGEYVAIVMGTTGASNDKNIFWGSNTAHVAAQSPIPLIAVPNKTFSTSIARVGLLTNFLQEELMTLQEVLHIFKQPVKLDLIHVDKDSEEVEAVNDKLESWIFNIREFPSIEEINMRTAPIVKEDKNLDTIPEVIEKLIKEQDIDLILISKSRKTFFERLFTPSVSKAMALELQKPAFFGKTI